MYDFHIRRCICVKIYTFSTPRRCLIIAQSYWYVIIWLITKHILLIFEIWYVFIHWSHIIHVVKGVSSSAHATTLQSRKKIFTKLFDHSFVSGKKYFVENITVFEENCMRTRIYTMACTISCIGGDDEISLTKIYKYIIWYKINIGSIDV